MSPWLTRWIDSTLAELAGNATPERVLAVAEALGVTVRREDVEARIAAAWAVGA